MLVLRVFYLFGMDLRYKENTRNKLNSGLALVFSLYTVLLTFANVISFTWMLIDDGSDLDTIVVNTMSVCFALTQAVVAYLLVWQMLTGSLAFLGFVTFIWSFFQVHCINFWKNVRQASFCRTKYRQYQLPRVYCRLCFLLSIYFARR